MWTISSFPDKLRPLLTLLGCFALMWFIFISCHPREGVYVIPRAPKAAPEGPGQAKPPTETKPSPIESSQLRTPVELRAVVVRKMDSTMARLAGPQFLETATDPLVIEVKSQIPFDPLPRTSSPVIVLNDKKLMNTYLLPDAADRLVAFLPDRAGIQDTNTVVVVWIGNEELTRTRRPLTFTKGEVGE